MKYGVTSLDRTLMAHQLIDEFHFSIYPVIADGARIFDGIDTSRMQLELITLQKEVGIAFVYVTHDQQEALALAHRIAVMNHARVEQLDEPSRIYSFPKNRLVALAIAWEAIVPRADRDRLGRVSR
jgi:ABC-type proline/glycine betaine transport system ATPase subunit